MKSALSEGFNVNGALKSLVKIPPWLQIKGTAHGRARSCAEKRYPLFCVLTYPGRMQGEVRPHRELMPSASVAGVFEII